MTGWIKISKDITKHWLWDDAERLKWWLDLLMLAAWEDKQVLVGKRLVTIYRGQLIASLSFLCSRWKRSRMMVEPFLNLLISEKMITKNVANNISIISVINYEKYQANDRNVDAYLSRKTYAYLDAPCNTDRQMVSAKTDAHLYAHLDAHLDATNKEYKEYNNNIINNARAREDDFLEKMKGDNLWRDTIAMRHHISPTDIDDWLRAFDLDCRCNDTEHRNLRDIKSHFNNWLRIQIKYNTTTTTNKNGNQSQFTQRRATEVGAVSAKEYATRF